METAHGCFDPTYIGRPFPADGPICCMSSSYPDLPRDPEVKKTGPETVRVTCFGIWKADAARLKRGDRGCCHGVMIIRADVRTYAQIS